MPSCQMSFWHSLDITKREKRTFVLYMFLVVSILFDWLLVLPLSKLINYITCFNNFYYYSLGSEKVIFDYPSPYNK